MKFSTAIISTFALVSGQDTTKRHHRYSRHFELDSYNFDSYLKESRKSYDAIEYVKRSEIFNENLKIIKEHNSQKHSWKMGVNKFTDMTQDELQAFLGGDKRALHNNKKKTTKTLNSSKRNSLPASVDWRETPNVISPVKDQGHCGSCWAFAATATIEAYVGLNTGVMSEVSMQELVSCMANDDSCGGDGGCQGATAELAFDYLTTNGLAELWSYGYLPNTYQSGINNQCLKSTPSVTATGYTLLPRNDYDEVMHVVANVGPVAVNVDASRWSYYESGVFSGCAQEDVNINHVVQTVGYGTDADHGDYWLVRNSWSAEYGEMGYIRVARSSGYCGMDYHNGAGVGCDYDPTNVTVCGMCGILYDTSYPNGATLA